MTIKQLQKRILSYYKSHGRHDLVWRHTKDPYEILVSEVMLQQTQVARVVPKFEAWLKKFPNVHALANASTAEILKAWVGLGYNNRALRLKACVQEIISQHHSKFPKNAEELEQLPGIGPYTARAITTFAYNKSEIFIETNIRTVILHHFFREKQKVDDKDLLPYLIKLVDKKNPREFYYALMDYGAYLKSIHPNPSRKSKHHQKQSKFEGSFRQKRSTITKLILAKPRTLSNITKLTKYDKITAVKVLNALQKDRLIAKRKSIYSII